MSFILCTVVKTTKVSKICHAASALHEMVQESQLSAEKARI